MKITDTNEIKFTHRELFAMWTAVCHGSPYYKRKLYTAYLKGKLFLAIPKELKVKLRNLYEISDHKH